MEAADPNQEARAGQLSEAHFCYEGPAHIASRTLRRHGLPPFSRCGADHISR
jgi:hypothetical protein